MIKLQLLIKVNRGNIKNRVKGEPLLGNAKNGGEK